MIKTSKKLKDLIGNLSKKESSGCSDVDATLYDGTISGANFSF